MEIPKGNSKGNLREREKIITQFYYDWRKSHPSRKVYNQSLKANISVEYLSLTETKRHAAKSYLSTLMVLQLDAILRLAVKKGKPVPVKQDVKNQKDFSRLIIMEYNLPGLGIAKMTVGIKKKTGENVQYCITALK